MTVADLPDDFASRHAEPLMFVTDSDDVLFLKQEFGPPATDFDSFFVRQKNGEVIEVYGMEGIVPHAHKALSRIK